MNLLLILATFSAASILSIAAGVIGAIYTRRIVVRDVGIPIAVRVHYGAQIAAGVPVIAVLALPLLGLSTLLPAIAVGACAGVLGFFVTKAISRSLK